MTLKSQSASCIVSQKNETALMRIFCFPYAGGGASVFRQWSGALPDRVEVCAVQPPGRENRISESPISNVHELVMRILPGMAPLFDKPFVFFGYSTGALVAFELVRELERQQMPLPENLIVGAARAPHIPEPSPLHHLPEDEFFRELKRFSGTPEAILQNKELMEIYEPILRADLAIEETYVLKDESPVNVPVSAFYGIEDQEAPEEVMAPWARYTTSGFDLVGFHGGHFFIKTAGKEVLEAISGILSRGGDLG